jgi:hypothetical protein
MVVHFREPEVFKRHMAHLLKSGIDIDGTGANLFEQGPELILVHLHLL